MERNIGSADRIIRLVAGLLLIVLPFVTGLAATAAWLAWASGIVGAVLVATALVRSCPLYTLLGLDTCGRHP